MMASLFRNGRICTFVFLAAGLFIDCSKSDGSQLHVEAGQAVASTEELGDNGIAFGPRILFGRCVVRYGAASSGDEESGTAGAPAAVGAYCDRHPSRRTEEVAMMTRGD